MEDAPKLLKIPKSECPDIWIRLPRHKWPKSWSSMEDPVVPLERNLYGHPLAGLLWEREFDEVREFDTAIVPAVHRQDLGNGSKDGDLANSCRSSAGTYPSGRTRDPIVAGKCGESAYTASCCFPETSDRGWCFQGTDKVHGEPLGVPRLVVQCEKSTYENGREICWTTAVDIGTDR